MKKRERDRHSILCTREEKQRALEIWKRTRSVLVAKQETQRSSLSMRGAFTLAYIIVAHILATSLMPSDHIRGNDAALMSAYKVCFARITSKAAI